MERKKDCPQCRARCTERNIFRIYFNNIPNLDASQLNSANLIETIDNLTLQAREKDGKIKTFDEEKSKLVESLAIKEKRIKKLNENVAQSNQIIATMRHEIDLLSTNRASYKGLEAENAELKVKLDQMQAVETVISASQREIDEVLRQNFSNKELSMMVGTLRRELSNNEQRKNELRKQNQMLKNDLRMEQEEKRKISEKISFLESENHRLVNRIRKVDNREDATETPEHIKKPRLALNMLDDQNTPSPLSRSDFEGRIKKIQESDSPYFKVKSSSLALTSALKPQILMSKEKSSTSSTTSKLSIFQKPRVLDNEISAKRTDNLIYNGMGGTSKILQSDLVEKPSLSILNAKSKFSFRKNLSASALNK